MALIVSECGEYEANGTYYEKQINPSIYIQTNKNHQIIEQQQLISQGYGACYKQKVWILQKINRSNGTPSTLYVSYLNKPNINKIKWKAINGCLPSPKVRNGSIIKNVTNDQATKRNYQRKRTFEMFNNYDMNYNQPPNKKIRFNMNQNKIQQKFHGNQCNQYQPM